MVELVDTPDLKSCGPQGPCGFDSRSRYIKTSRLKIYSYRDMFLLILTCKIKSIRSRHLITVSKQGFHPWNRGSTPRGVTNNLLSLTKLYFMRD